MGTVIMLYIVLRDKFLPIKILPYNLKIITFTVNKIELCIYCGQSFFLLQYAIINLYRTVSYAVATHRPFHLLCAGCNLCKMIPC
jgi:hypothetical protein